jgi:hypothetical protein
MCVRKAWVYYVSPERRRLFAWAHLIRETPHDVLYLNSLFNPVYTLLPLLSRRLAGLQMKPVVVAPRGEFSTGALGLKRWKKRPFLAGANIVGPYRNVLWHASTEDEARLILRQFGGAARIVTARNLPPISGQQRTSSEAIDAPGLSLVPALIFRLHQLNAEIDWSLSQIWLRRRRKLIPMSGAASSQARISSARSESMCACNWQVPDA